MSDMENVSWIKQFWQPIILFLGIGVAGIKNHVDTKTVKKAVFDSNGDIRFLSKRDHDKAEETRTRELQNIHASIDRMQTDISDMPQKIAEHLKTMGHLK